MWVLFHYGGFDGECTAAVATRESALEREKCAMKTFKLFFVILFFF